jgi:abortive infection bacteriophage resistance protein
MKIMDKLKQKIAMKLSEKIGHELGGIDGILAFLNEKSINDQIKELVKLDRI